MKRKLVKYEEVFHKNSLSTVVNELTEAQDHLARTLGTTSLVLESFDDNSVIYRNDDGNFVKANYSVEEDAVTFENIEELVVDQDSENNKRREIVSEMLEAILSDKEADANILFEKYMKMASLKYSREGSLLPPQELDESYVRLYGTRGKAGAAKVSVRTGAKDPKKSAAAKKAHRLHPDSYKSGGRKRHANVAKERSRRKTYKNSYSRLHNISGGKQYKRHLNEWMTLSNNVFEYADIIENGYVLKESLIRKDAYGDITSVKLPSEKARNEGKILKMHYDKMIKQDSPKVMRENALKLATNPQFSQAVAELKRYNNVSNHEALEETLVNIVKYFPSVLYLTQEELAKTINYALESAGSSNHVDSQCAFMAEGILRTAHDLHEDKVQKLFALNKFEIKEGDDKFASYQKVAANYFPTLDEAIQTEQKVFEDLYNAVLDIRKYALEGQNEEVRAEANEFVSELQKILAGEAVGNIDFAVEVADWLHDIAEANLPGASEKWDVVKTPFDTVAGDHPQMAKNAKVSGAASEYPGDWNGQLSPQIGMDSNKWNHGDEAKQHGFSNKGGKDVWPTLENPAVLSPYGNWTMKGDKSVGDDESNALGQWQDASGSVWPQLQNPYCPKSLVPHQKVDPSNSVE